MFNQYSPYGGYGYPGMGYPSLPTLNTSSPTYSPTGGGTNQGQQLQQLVQTLSRITTNPQQTNQIDPNQLQNLYSQAYGQSANMSGNQNQFAQQTQNQNIQSSGIPGLIGQYGNMSQLFQMWQADKGYASQFGNQSPTANLNPYANPQLLAASQQGQQQLTQQNQADQSAVSNMTTPNQPGAVIAAPQQPTGGISGSVTQVPNPFLGSTQSIIDSTNNLPTPPSVVTSEMAQPMNATTNFMNLINSLIGAEQGVASNATSQDISAYQDKMNVFNTLANLLGGAVSNISSAQQPGSAAYSQTQIQNAYKDAGGSMTLQDMLKKYEPLGMTPNDIYAVYNTINQPGKGYGPAKQSAQELAQLGITGAPVTQSANAAKLAQGQSGYTRDQIVKQFQTMQSAFQNAAAHPWDPNAYNDYNTQKSVLADILSYGLTKSRSWQTVNRMLSSLPNPRDFNPLSTSSVFGAKGAFEGMNQQLNSTADQVFGKNSSSSSNSGGTTLMTGPDGKQWNVPNSKVSLFKQNGYK